MKWKNAKDPGEPGTQPYSAQVLNEQHYAFIKRFYEEVLAEHNLSHRQIRRTLASMPVELIRNWIKRVEDHLNELKENKEDKINEWKQLCESNFTKSLDHRSFFFKKEQKDLLPQKKQQAELERIANTPLSQKSVN